MNLGIDSPIHPPLIKRASRFNSKFTKEINLNFGKFIKNGTSFSFSTARLQNYQRYNCRVFVWILLMKLTRYHLSLGKAASRARRHRAAGTTHVQFSCTVLVILDFHSPPCQKNYCSSIGFCHPGEFQATSSGDLGTITPKCWRWAMAALRVRTFRRR